ncbi:nitrile hydratase subunit beta [Hyphomicrobiales bacterium]|jgi:hypothetical protein|nr:nitrile hydratase subunit beta [Hyphomicrobiales bacterium]MDB4831356.1 nitrile hydratase subunit beta [Hyphomicrobiales bacterium]MDC0139837.1 nitrile hydratase subunit beta [Hyphomicrobiales bacterium]|tara:strand:- start:335 stop:649 length:315 start_codon:yes stop_codon:yes gene_type:complete
MLYDNKSSSSPCFDKDSGIRVAKRSSEGHCRTPAYIRGKIGVIERYCGNFPNPEQIAICHPKPDVIPLYRCRFYQKDIWPHYSGNDCDTLELEIFEHWLEPATF